jgi:hypothetical protein
LLLCLNAIRTASNALRPKPSIHIYYRHTIYTIAPVAGN